MPKNTEKDKSHDFQPKLNIATEYDHYYQDGELSLYNRRFGKSRVIPRERSVINSAFKRIYNNITIYKKQKIKTFRILDFGCGDGRLFPVINELAQRYPDINIVLIAYDPSRVALDTFKNFLEVQSYKNSNVQSRNKKHGYIDSCYNKDNLIVVLIHANIKDKPSYIKTLIKEPINLIFSFFTVLGLILKRNKRQCTIKSLKKILCYEGEMIINVSTKQSVVKQVEAYDLLRSQYHIAKKNNIFSVAKNLKKTLSLATEPGDFYNIICNGLNTVSFYGHAYNAAELIEDLQSANLSVSSAKVLSIDQPYILSKKPIMKFVDAAISIVLSINFYPFNEFSKIAKNIFVIGKKIS